MGFRLKHRLQTPAPLRAGAWALVLALALLGSPGALARELPRSAPFTTLVSLDTGPAGLELETALRTLAKAAGVPLLTKDVPKARVVFKATRPFSDMVRLLVRIYAPQLDYVWLPEKILLVAPKELVDAAVPPPPKAAQAPQPAPAPRPGATAAAPAAPAQPQPAPAPATATASVGVPALGAEAAALAKALAPQVAAMYVQSARLLVLQGEAEALAALVPLLGEAEQRAAAERPAAPAAPQAEKPAERWQRFDLPGGTPARLEEAARAATAIGASGVVTLAGEGALLVRGSELTLALVRELLTPPGREAPAAPAAPGRLAFSLPGGAEALAGLKALFPNLEIVPLAPGHYAAKGSAEALAELQAFLPQLAPAFAPAEGALAKGAAPVYLKGYAVFGEPSEVEAALRALYPKDAPGVQVSVLKEAKRVVVRAPLEVHQEVVALLKQIDPPRAAVAPASPAQATVRARTALAHLKPAELAKFLKDYGLDVEVVAEPAGGSVWIKGPRAAVEQALALLPRLDRPAPQARLHVKVVQVSKSEFGTLSADLQATLGGLKVGLGPGGVSAGYVLPADVASALSLRLSALEGRGGARTLVDSDLTAKDQSPARLRSGGTLVAQTQPGSGNGGGNGGGSQAPSGLANIEYGMTLEFTPAVRPGDQPTVELQARVELGDLPRSGPANTIDLPKRSLEATYRLTSGQTALLGGLIQQHASESQSGVPVLSQIPLLGLLFSSSQSTAREDVLLIFTSVLALDVPPPAPEIRLDQPPVLEAEPPADTREPPLPLPGVPAVGSAPAPAAPSAPTAAPAQPLPAASAPREPAQAPAPAPAEPAAQPQTAAPRPAFAAEAPLANWVQATLVRTARGPAIYLQSRPRSPLARPLAVLARGERGEQAVGFRALTQTLSPASALVLALEEDPAQGGFGSFAVVLEDELGGVWRVEVR